MKKLLPSLILILFNIIVSLNSEAASSISFYKSDTTPSVKIIRATDRKLIEGDLMYATADSLYILPGTKRDAKKGLFYQQMVISYTDVYLIRIREFSWVSPLLLGLGGMALLILGISGRVSLANNLNGLVFILLSPIVFGLGIKQLLKRKQYFINGEKERYEKFRTKLKERK